MQTLSLLAGVSFPLLEEGFQVAGSWLAWLTNLIKLLIEGVGITGVGIILFTLILKAVTLPFDIYQRVSMRKQTLIMRNMQPELDKLQKQYANDKTMYSQKMMELYKKNGYSMFGACLPMIISLLILIFAFQSLNEFSQMANLAMYERMTSSYNAAVLQYAISEEEATEDEITVETREGEGEYVVIKGKAADKFLYMEYNKGETAKNVNYKIDVEKMRAYFAAQETDALSTFRANKIATVAEYTEESYTWESACSDYLSEEVGGNAAAKSYHDDPPSFLWIKNIWYPDVSYNHPIQSYKDFAASITAEIQLKDGSKSKISAVIDDGMYNRITSKLTVEKTQPNGYFILIILSIGLMVLSQFISMKSNKEANKYQTADGSGQSQQKMMMIMMPLIYAIFAFMYSAAFSIYMAMSSVISIVVTLLSNLIIDRIFRKKEEEEFKKQHTRTLPWQNKDGSKKNKK